MYYGIPNKRCSRAWIGPDGDLPIVLGRDFHNWKRLFPVFFKTQGIVGIDILPVKALITASYYTNVVLSKVVSGICLQHPTVGTSQTSLLPDNAAAHKA